MSWHLLACYLPFHYFRGSFSIRLGHPESRLLRKYKDESGILVSKLVYKGYSTLEAGVKLVIRGLKQAAEGRREALPRGFSCCFFIVGLGSNTL